MNIMLRRIFCSLFVVGMTVIYFIGVAYAGEWSSSQSWGTQTATYSPDYGNTSFYRYESNGLKVSPKVRFQFDSNAVTAIHNYFQNDEFYYTMDISITNHNDVTKNAYNYFYSTLPNPHFDLDDDPEPFGNGYNDETEVVSLSPNQISSGTDYRFESYYHVLSESNDPYFAFTSQESEETFYGEYNVAKKNGVSLYQTHLTRIYPW